MTHETIERTEAAFELVETMTGVHGTVTLSGGTAVVRIDGDTEQYRFDGFDRALRSGRYYVPGPDAWDALQARLEDR